MHNTFLLEIGTEEMPAKYMTSLISQLKNNVEKKFIENRISYKKIECYGTPRRIAVLVYEIAEKQTEFEKKVKGPSKKVAYNENNEPTKALLGFLKSNNFTSEEVYIDIIDNVEYVFVKKVEKGIDCKTILPRLLLELIFSLKFQKSMRWNNYNFRFARPIRWLVPLWNNDIINLLIEGIKSSNTTKGHRTLSNHDVIIDNAENYIKILRDSKIIVNQTERKEIILNQIKILEKSLGAKVIIDRDLLEEVVYLVEYPTSFYGSFDEEFLELPKEAIITPMKDHQKYFPVVRNNQLLSFFVAVRNGDERSLKSVQKGNERVLRARLKDAQFFYNEDLKEKLESKVDKLKTIVYQAKLGTVFDKVRRIQKLSKEIAEKMELSNENIKKLDRAALLCKADLITSMVNEFDKLQGIMGKEYALKNGEDSEVAEAICSHYLPRYSEDEIPSDKFGVIISVADKIDSIVGSFGIGIQPTGSQDPFGLRRQAIGIINILLKHSIKIDMGFLFDVAINLLRSKITVDKNSLKRDLDLFFKQRLRVIFNEDGYRYDLVEAVLDIELKDLFSLKEKLVVLNSLVKTEDFKSLLGTMIRVYTLSKKAESVLVNTDFFESVQEKKLFGVINKVKNEFTRELKYGNYLEMIKVLTVLSSPVNDFFNNVMVMVDEIATRNNRLALLKNIELLSKNVCNFEKIVI